MYALIRFLRPISGRYGIAVAVLITLFCVNSLTSSFWKSPTFDEPAHIAAGLSYLQTGAFVVNPQHPPLLKELSGLSLMSAGVQLLDTASVRNMFSGVPGADYSAGSELIGGLGPDMVLFWARLPFVLLASFLGLLVFWWGRQIVGSGAALGALFLYALSPTVLAHSYLVATDLGFAAFATLYFFALWSYLRYPNWKRLVACGLAMGAMLATKFSAVALPPVGALLMLASLRWPVQKLPGSPPALWKRAKNIPVPAVGKNEPCPCGSGRKYKVCHAAMPEVVHQSTLRMIAGCVMAFFLMCGVAALVVEACYFFPSDWTLYLRGMQQVNVDHNPQGVVLLAGHLGHHFLSYFAIVYLLKEPLAAILSVAAGLILLVRSPAMNMLSKLFLLLPPAVLFVGYSISADDLGVRYLLPLLPFAYLIGGFGLYRLFMGRFRWLRVVAAGLTLWMIVNATAIYPDHLSYFNELACMPSHVNQIGLDGGSRCGVSWLSDHNVDWGQGLKQLSAWLNQNESGRAVNLAYFGSFPPSYYGLTGRSITLPQLIQPRPPETGLYAISAHSVALAVPMGAQSGDGAGSWLQGIRPIAIVGHAYYIYDVRRAPPTE